jgi:hypothetical protein
VAVVAQVHLCAVAKGCTAHVQQVCLTGTRALLYLWLCCNLSTQVPMCVGCCNQDTTRMPCMQQGGDAIMTQGVPLPDVPPAAPKCLTWLAMSSRGTIRYPSALAKLRVVSCSTPCKAEHSQQANPVSPKAYSSTGCSTQTLTASSRKQQSSVTMQGLS